MERPDLKTHFFAPGKTVMLVAKTQDIVEADKIADHYKMQGYDARIVKKSSGSISIYEVWVYKEPDIIVGKAKPLN